MINVMQSRLSPGPSSWRSVFLVWQEFATHDDVDTIALRVGFTIDIQRKIDRTHNAITKFLVNQFLESGAINIDQLIEAIYQRIGGHCRGQRPAGSPGPLDRKSPSGSKAKMSAGLALAGSTIIWQSRLARWRNMLYLMP